MEEAKSSEEDTMKALIIMDCIHIENIFVSATKRLHFDQDRIDSLNCTLKDKQRS